MRHAAGTPSKPSLCPFIVALALLRVCGLSPSTPSSKKPGHLSAAGPYALIGAQSKSTGSQDSRQKLSLRRTPLISKFLPWENSAMANSCTHHRIIARARPATANQGRKAADNVTSNGNRCLLKLNVVSNIELSLCSSSTSPSSVIGGPSSTPPSDLSSLY
ncbi:hypothetical protein THAOC_12442 [Thalassiosira oceanica]|uniref:Secreted protein n=1 Tax=Thalassiosira oceanica TaxID=159749 RepID=K0SNU3_THAOC|nr:hypothetical protein THAOC_12442 [Thalassiosira oceanica]|eukprot:EJK66629.1 hypothetical protein THAOC_12442 [Thalassiosira oceanica]